jgi:predicted RNase H-like HicB family nuclease
MRLYSDELYLRAACTLCHSYFGYRGACVRMPEQQYKIETEQEEDGRWLAEILNLPGVMAYGKTREEAVANAEVIALRVIADQIDASKIATGQVSFAYA